MSPSGRLIAAGAGAAVLLGLTGWAQSQTRIHTQPFRDVPVAAPRGQSVTPAFEGWYANADGTFNLSWGYMNRNYEERLDIPVGPANRLEPGAPDQGQPTHFLPRRQTGVFAVTVPADFGDRTLTWTLTSYGETVSVPGHLRPEWEIDALRQEATDNTPPVVRFEPEGPHAQGPRGVRTALAAQASDTVPLEVWIADDLVLRSTGNYPLTREPRLGVVWSKYRCSGKVAFSEIEPELDAAGKAVTTATFDAPGAYVLRVLAWDDSGPQGPTMAVGFQCCWTNGYVDVLVK